MLNKYVNKTLILVPIFTNLSIPGPSLWLYILHMILESSLIYEHSLTSSEVRFLVYVKIHGTSSRCIRYRGQKMCQLQAIYFDKTNALFMCLAIIVLIYLLHLIQRPHSWDIHLRRRICGKNTILCFEFIVFRSI